MELENKEIYSGQKTFGKESVPLTAFWAIDPFDYEHEPHLDSLVEVRNLLGGSFERTTPVFISGGPELTPFSVKEKIQEFLGKFQIGKLQDPMILKSNSSDKKAWVKDLIQAAVQTNAKVIILSSHGRRGLSKWLVGSFAENLLLESPLPILFLSPEAQRPISQVLFATDFSQDSKKAFFQFLKMIDGSDKELILFHAIAMPINAIGIPQFGGEMGPASGGSYWIEQNKWAQEESTEWIADAQKNGFKVRLHAVIEEAMTQPGFAVLEYAKKENVGLIALASHGKHRGQIFFGNITQDILASRQFIVWACGPQFLLSQQI